MKKIMIAFAAIAMAVAANASTFSWGLASGSFDTTKFANATAYLFYTSASSLSLPSTTGWDSKSSFTLADVTSSGATQIYSAKVTGGLFDGSSLTVSEGSVTSMGGKTGVMRFYMAVISDDGQNVALTTTTTTARIMSSATAAGATWADTKIATYTAVPEPTSGLLLLLGMAGLALKRKVA